MADTLDGYELRSLITAEGQLRISREPIAVDDPGPGEVIVRVEAAPINPSDLGLLVDRAIAGTFRTEGTADNSVLVADLPADRLPAVALRVGKALAVGNEGAGTVVKAGPDVQHLLGRKVAAVGGGMYATYRKLPAAATTLLPEDASAADGASAVVNPRTALGFVETMRMEGHSAIVHTAAASNLGQMLLRICLADGVPLVNIVRSEAQAALLRGIGATHVVDSSTPDFRDRLIDAIAATGATIAFDAIGGGTMASQILDAMEVVAARSLESFNRYGSNVMKQVYIYGTLDPGPTIIERTGYAWKVDGWLLTHFLQKANPETLQSHARRVQDELKTTFASRFGATISLSDVLNPQIARAYERKGTGAKYLIDPSL
ncbi:zinc-binding dehydrogenase [Sphingobium nicotianae]|uniref:Zinc-binding dehydrogenase n=1 Tax=Sphingobium nicotianae TaxID=2782607 RepID=A0A9X1DFH1_9SPHN|nr:zinc-binding dehydrogenase [Sphingobium nicotianae]MBT2188949.1 zinc-binding dehydrogenase [Sphingobium nicotianae]